MMLNATSKRALRNANPLKLNILIVCYVFDDHHPVVFPGLSVAYYSLRKPRVCFSISVNNMKVISFNGNNPPLWSTIL